MLSNVVPRLHMLLWMGIESSFVLREKEAKKEKPSKSEKKANLPVGDLLPF